MLLLPNNQIMAAKEAHLYTAVIIRCTIASLEEEEREACIVSKKKYCNPSES
jgi:hypothetical protein